jgi:predicted DCC family thiol-disulfide oxidoreductase YuxK
MTPALYAACRRAVHVITANGQIINAGRASMFILEEIGYPRWLVRPFTWPPLVWFTELGYRVVADNRPFFSKFMFTQDLNDAR